MRVASCGFVGAGRSQYRADGAVHDLRGDEHGRAGGQTSVRFLKLVVPVVFTVEIPALKYFKTLSVDVSLLSGLVSTGRFMGFVPWKDLTCDVEKNIELVKTAC